MKCQGLFDHAMEKMETVKITNDTITKLCMTCGYQEVLPRSKRNVLFPNNLAMQKLKWSADDTKKELLQPLNNDGSVNDDFTKANGYNPFDSRTKATLPKIQGGQA